MLKGSAKKIILALLLVAAAPVAALLLQSMAATAQLDPPPSQEEFAACSLDPDVVRARDVLTREHDRAAPEAVEHGIEVAPLTGWRADSFRRFSLGDTEDPEIPFGDLEYSAAEAVGKYIRQDHAYQEAKQAHKEAVDACVERKRTGF